MNKPILNGIIVLGITAGGAAGLAKVLDHIYKPDESYNVTLDDENYVVTRWNRQHKTSVGPFYGRSWIVDDDGDLNPDFRGTEHCCDRYCNYSKTPVNEWDRKVFDRAISMAGIR